METKFTKGEWKSLKTGLNETCMFSDIDMEHIFKINHNEVVGSQAEGNANLISAAPDMFNSIVKLQEWSKKYPPGRIYSYGEAATIERELTEIVEEQLKAIQKAEPSVSF